MKRLIVFCEGRSEVNFVKNLLIPTFINRLIVIPETLPTGNTPCGGDSKGGWRKSGGYDHGLKEMKNLANLHRNDSITTLFDLYGFPSDIPCFNLAQGICDPLEKAREYEKQLNADIAEFNENIRFFSYIQPCELEALLFVDPEIASLEMAKDDNDMKRIKTDMEAIRGEFPTPEHINDDERKAPSKRLESIIPGYRKNKSGRAGFSWRVAKEIGINKLRSECVHFNNWVSILEDL